jgi:hypothetical protein
MGHVEIVDGQEVIIEKVDFSRETLCHIHQRLGILPLAQALRQSRQRQASPQEKFLKGPIPLPWLQCAAQLPGKALHVGIALWYLVGLTSSSTVTMTRTCLKRFGIHHETGRRALLALEQAGLIHVERNGRKSPRVTIPVRKPGTLTKSVHKGAMNGYC